ncbi:hypothetical protein [Desmospora activa]|uniref:Uncharacterized protein n=1 Tax=Desmospora activa DSM 45169 TaxID=1121389 RepID=A0A2T4Z9W1_9BACL|nr:hypothetical protein [Desmospora activa]PTM58655.1 hypothetical protein C8J48_1242 [Desmospora activa DSM 45169]
MLIPADGKRGHQLDSRLPGLKRADFVQTVKRNGKGRYRLEVQRYLVRIRCKQCGERFILKGSYKKDRVETGFKQCLCNNESEFEILTEKL